jgi:chromosome partitioning protein
VRTLLVASQKGGVGKTTTAVNLAALAARAGSRVLLLDADPLGSVTSSLQLLRSEGEIVPRPDGVTGKGLVWQNVVPNVDVVSPYPDDDSSDDRLLDFTSRMAKSPIARFYDKVIIDAPPMLGPRPKMLLKAADEVVIVQRAEPMSFRTLPAYLDIFREAKNEGSTAQLRGILLTLPAGMAPGSKAEQALRAKFKGLLPQSIPFAADVNQALVFGRPIVESHPDSAVSKQYEQLAVTLGLATAAAVKPVLVAAGGVDAAEVNWGATPAAGSSPSGLIATAAEIRIDADPATQTPAPKKSLAKTGDPKADAKSDLIWLAMATAAVLVTLAGGVWLLAGGTFGR